MKTFQYTIKDELGIHARPAGLLVKEAKKSKSKVIISANGKEAEATRLMMIMALGIKKGMVVDVSVEGQDEEITVENIKDFFENNL